MKPPRRKKDRAAAGKKGRSAPAAPRAAGRGAAEAGAPAGELPSRFTGGAFANFFLALLTRLVSLLTLFIAYPAMMCMHMRWKVSHTYYCGRRLGFDGTARALFKKYLLWLLLSVLTLGIFAVLALPGKLARWQLEHTHIEGQEGSGESAYTGNIWGVLRVNVVTKLVTLLTLSFGAYWAHCYKERWYAAHRRIDGFGLAFDGTGMQCFGTFIRWVLLTVLTLGVYAFWLLVKAEDWTARHTRFAQTEGMISPRRQEECRRERPVRALPPSAVFGSAGYACAVAGLLSVLSHCAGMAAAGAELAAYAAAGAGYFLLFGAAGLALSALGAVRCGKDGGAALAARPLSVLGMCFALAIPAAAGLFALFG